MLKYLFFNPLTPIDANVHFSSNIGFIQHLLESKNILFLLLKINLDMKGLNSFVVNNFVKVVFSQSQNASTPSGLVMGAERKENL